VPISKTDNQKAPRNRTLQLAENERSAYRNQLSTVYRADHECQIINSDAFVVLKTLPRASFDLLFADPPYNLSKDFGTQVFRRRSGEDYELWLDSWLSLAVPLLKPNASVYVCADWRSSGAIERAAGRYFQIRNRITWEREKGRGAKANWKNSSEDIWFMTVSDSYTFNVDAVKQRRRVMAPYRDGDGPKDWTPDTNGAYRDTHPSNLWTDISVPFWSMPENTDHPTQKPEKLLAKIILASTNAGDLVLDPFAGSGTTAVAAKKLGRRCVAIEADAEHCMMANKRLEIAEAEKRIQGYADGVYWERNSAPGR
jgi:site-specific DNA-methyltransferase (adenine-specific)